MEVLTVRLLTVVPHTVELLNVEPLTVQNIVENTVESIVENICAVLYKEIQVRPQQ